MSDCCLELLLKQVSHVGSAQVWFADEHHGDMLHALTPFKDELLILSNRFDVAEQARQAELETQYNDWALTTSKSIKTAYLRVCKEKPVTNHLIHQAFDMLCDEGQLILVGQKNEGIKSYEKLASAIFTGDPKTKALKKVGTSYIASYTKKTSEHAIPTDPYNELTVIGEWQGSSLSSKPGVYGWDKIDKGSAVLVEHLDAIIEEYAQSTDRILDLGCGYGFLSMASAHVPCVDRVATDNNAAAIICTKHNAHENEVELEVIPGDCGDQVTGRFDLILCNPPFHKGFDVDSKLTDKFLLASRNKLSPKGIAVFVVNSFIPIEKKLKKYFPRARNIVNTGQFKVLVLSV